jgi:N-acetylmuramoyl-L-alanine amidase
MFDLLQPISKSIIRLWSGQRFTATVALLLVLSFLTPVIPGRVANGATQINRHIAPAQPIGQRVNCGASAYRVRPGDTLGSIARRFGTTSRAIRQCNNLSSSVVYVGQILSIPGVVNNSVSTPKARVTRFYGIPPTNNSTFDRTYDPYFHEGRATPVPRR